MTITKAEHTLAHTRALIAGHMLPGLTYTITHLGHLEIDTTYHERHCEDFLADFKPLADKIAFEMRDYDHPISRSQGLSFCKFMEFNEKDTATILAACVSDRAYDNWVSEEMRSMAEYM